MQIYKAEIIDDKENNTYRYIAEFNKEAIDSDNVASNLHKACILIKNQGTVSLSDVLKIMVLMTKRIENV